MPDGAPALPARKGERPSFPAEVYPVRRLMHIGEVSDRTGLSLRTIRHYETVGIIGAPERTDGGFRVYTEAEVRRMDLVRRMRPLGFCLEELRTLLDMLEKLPGTDGRRLKPGDDADKDLLTGLRWFRRELDARCDRLRRELSAAESFALSLRGLTHLLPKAGAAGAMDGSVRGPAA